MSFVLIPQLAGRWVNSPISRRSHQSSDQSAYLIRPQNEWRPREDSNLRTRLRRPMLYPLSYEGRETAG